MQQLAPALAVLLHHPDLSVLVDAAWAISYLTDAGERCLQAVIQHALVPKLVPLLSHQETKVAAPGRGCCGVEVMGGG